MTTKLLRKAILAAAMVLAGASQASAQKESIAVVFRSQLPYYSSPQASNGQPLGYFMPGTRGCVTDEFILNGSNYLGYILPYSKGVAWTKIPHYNTPAEGQQVIATLFALDPANDIGCKAGLASLLLHRAPQPPPPLAANPTAPQTAPKITVSPQDTIKYTAYLDKTIKHDAAGWVMNEYVPGSVRDLRVYLDKDNGSLTGLLAHYTFTDGGFCEAGNKVADQHANMRNSPYVHNVCNKSGWVAIKLDRETPCLVYWDNKDTCRPVTEHDPAYKIVQAIAENARRNPNPPSTHNTTPNFVGEMIKENMWRCGGIGYGLSGC